jgi:putative colanic acid biosynthesis UDP-glucose lipid carrier transferase
MGRTGLLRTNENFVGALQHLGDAFWIALAHYIAVSLYHEEFGTEDLSATAIAIVAFLLVAEANGLYRSWRGAPMLRELRELFATWVFVPLLLVVLAFITKTSAQFSRFISVAWFVLAPSLMLLWRIAVRICLLELRRRGRNSRTVAVVGATEVAEKLCARIAEDPWFGMNLLGIYDDRNEMRRFRSTEGYMEVKGTFAQLIEAARAGQIDIIYITLPMRAEPRIKELLSQLADTTATVYAVADFFVFEMLFAQWSQVGDIPVVSIFDTPFIGIGGWLKRLEDILLGAVILTLIALPMLVVAIAIKTTSPGPVFFRQRRYGLNGKEIRVLKFRTMTVLEDGDTIRQATENDERVTSVGRFLRRTSLDELPQFIQVLTGEMSIVGPRPHAVAHNELYRSKIHGYMLRHKVKPGITGWAQVNGWRGETDALEKMEKRVEHDLEYIRNWNLSWDLKIIFWTVFGSKKSRNAH